MFFLFFFKNVKELILTKENLKSLSNENDLDYVLISGQVAPVSIDIESNYKNVRGVMKVIELKEHGTRWRNDLA